MLFLNTPSQDKPAQILFNCHPAESNKSMQTGKNENAYHFVLQIIHSKPLAYFSFSLDKR